MTRTQRFFAAFVLAAALPATALAQDDGQSRFLSWCSACHQATGQGVKGAFPALAGDAFVRGDPVTVASTVLNGRGGMPSFKADLKDAEIAQILTYVRSSWGNTRRARDGGAGRRGESRLGRRGDAGLAGALGRRVGLAASRD